jgi:hypothetical protein
MSRRKDPQIGITETLGLWIGFIELPGRYREETELKRSRSAAIRSLKTIVRQMSSDLAFAEGFVKGLR